MRTLHDDKSYLRLRDEEIVWPVRASWILLGSVVIVFWFALILLLLGDL